MPSASRHQLLPLQGHFISLLNCWCKCLIGVPMWNSSICDADTWLIRLTLKKCHAKSCQTEARSCTLLGRQVIATNGPTYFPECTVLLLCFLCSLSILLNQRYAKRKGPFLVLHIVTCKFSKEFRILAQLVFLIQRLPQRHVRWSIHWWLGVSVELPVLSSGEDIIILN